MDLQNFAANQKYTEQMNALIPANKVVELPEGKSLEIMYAHPSALQGSQDKSYVILVLPGGGYEFCSFREGRCVAQAFAQQGFNAAVLNYTVKNLLDVAKDHTGLGIRPMIEVGWAIDALRNDQSLGFTNSRIVVCGFSAGGHLAASIATRHNDQQLLDAWQWRGSLRPDGAVLCYPVISANPFLAHKGSFQVLTGSNDEKQWEAFSCEKTISPDTPPTFIWHTAEDTLVPCENSLIFAQIMWRNSCVAELHIYPKGDHGMSLGVEGIELDGNLSRVNPYASDWLQRATKFIKTYV